jgi:hypothetical protein
MEANIRQHSATPDGADRLTPKREKAVPALLNHATMAEAAAAVGVCEVTMGRWLKQPAFQDAYRTARREAVTLAMASIQAAAAEAVETLREVMGNAEAPAASRVTAARAVLESAMKAVALEDVIARVEALEAALPPAGSRRGRWN